MTDHLYREIEELKDLHQSALDENARLIAENFMNNAAVIKEITRLREAVMDLATHITPEQKQFSESYKRHAALIEQLGTKDGEK